MPKFFSVIAIIAAVIVTGCGNSKKNEPTKSRNSYSSPQLNESKEITLLRRGDDYAASCLFLNDSFHLRNTCAISVQTDLSIQGIQVTDQQAEFIKLPHPSSLSSFSLENGSNVGKKINSNQVVVGDIWYFKKSDSIVKYELIFEILSVDDKQITFRYQVKNFVNLW